MILFFYSNALWPAVAVGGILKKPNLDFDAIKSASFIYVYFKSSIFDISSIFFLLLLI